MKEITRHKYPIHRLRLHTCAISGANANMDPNKWSYTNGVKDIGINKTVANVNFIGPKFESASAKDIPELPSSIIGQVETGIQSQGYNRAGRRDISRTGPVVNIGGRQSGLAKGAAILDIATFGLQQYMNIAWLYDGDKVQEHINIAAKAVQNVTQALNAGMIPD